MKKTLWDPVTLEQGEIHCDTCGGTGYLLTDKGKIHICKQCEGKGKSHICPKCGKQMFSCCKTNNCTGWDKLIEEAFEKADKTDYTNAKSQEIERLYSHLYKPNDGIFETIAEFKDYCKTNSIPEPRFVWCTTKTNGNYEPDFRHAITLS